MTLPPLDVSPEDCAVLKAGAERTPPSSGRRRPCSSAASASRDDLVAKIMSFIADYDTTAKPFKWTYDGKPLKGGLAPGLAHGQNFVGGALVGLVAAEPGLTVEPGRPWTICPDAS